MRLQTCSEEETLYEHRVKRVAARKIYYCVEGRNAWWATWVQRYSEGCMHFSFSDAAAYVEESRTQGSVFYIIELPALIVESDRICLAFTQINCDSPLVGYSANALKNVVIPFRKRVEGVRNNYLQRGALLDGVFLSFEYDSRFWRSPPPPYDSVVRLISLCALESFEALPKDQLMAYKSRSIGSKYALEWEAEKSNIKFDAVRLLATHA